MDKEQFRQYLLDLYRPLIEQPNDEQGGFLLPHYYTGCKAGRLAAFYRWLGGVLRSPRIYEKGTYQFDLYAALRNKRKEMK